MDGYTLTAQALKTAKSYGMKAPEYLIYADLRAAGWCKRDAWSVAFQGTGLNWEKAELEREMNKLEALGSVQRRVAEQQEKSRGDEISPEELAKETSKETILKKLVRAEKKAKFGSTDWMKFLALVAYDNKFKQDEIVTETNTIHFHLPVDYPTCKEDCLLFKNNLCKGGK